MEILCTQIMQAASGLTSEVELITEMTLLQIHLYQAYHNPDSYATDSGFRFLTNLGQDHKENRKSWHLLQTSQTVIGLLLSWMWKQKVVIH